MSHDLYKLENGGFKVKSFKLDKTHFYFNIEQAAEVLESIGIPSDEIDVALVDMTVKGTNHANFGVKNGMFIFSDSVDAPELVE